MEAHTWMTSAEAAEYLRLSPRTIIELARDRKIPGHILSGITRHTWRFRRDELDRFMMGESAVSEKARVM